jgi:hypothetical protein
MLFRSTPSFTTDGGGCQPQEKVDASSAMKFEIVADFLNWPSRATGG